MKVIENLWQQYLRTEYPGALPPEDQVATQRHAFFTGAWCLLAFDRKVRSLDSTSARTLGEGIELELAREVTAAAPQTVATSDNQLAA